jgi:hypothetical protein
MKIIKYVTIIGTLFFKKIFANKQESKYNKERGSLTMGYFDNLDNGPLNKYKKSL